MTFIKWIDTLNSEKNIDLETVFQAEGESGTNFIPCAVVIEHIKIASPAEQAQIKNMLVKIDFKNGNIMHFYKHLAGAIAQ